MKCQLLSIQAEMHKLIQKTKKETKIKSIISIFYHKKGNMKVLENILEKYGKNIHRKVRVKATDVRKIEKNCKKAV